MVSYDEHKMLEEFFNILGVFVFILLLFYLTVLLILHVFMAIGLFKLASEQSIEHGWLSFLPIANMYILGKLVDHDVHVQLRGCLSWVLPITCILPFLIGSVFDGFLLNIILGGCLAIYFYAIYFLFKIYSVKNIVFFVFSIITLGFLTPIFIFVIRNNKRVCS